MFLVFGVAIKQFIFKYTDISLQTQLVYYIHYLFYYLCALILLIECF